jgi:glycosyltransferase involved in cell wall biosynthesis
MAHLSEQEVPDSLPWEVIVVNNASTDQTAYVAQQHWPRNATAPLRVINERRLGLSHARRRGFSEAKFEYVSFIDDDNWVAPNWVRVVFEIMNQHPEVGACGGFADGVYEVVPSQWFLKYAGYYAIGDQGAAGDITLSRGILWGAGLTIRKSAWQLLGENGFRPGLVGRSGNQITSGEDNELCLALRLAGWHIWYEKGLSLRHWMPAQRMQWPYFRRLYRAAAAAAVSYDPYLRALEPPPEDLLARAKQSWWWQSLELARELAMNPRRWIRMLRNLREGDDDVLWIDWRIGRLRELIRLRASYDQSVAAVRRAPWRQPAKHETRSFSQDHCKDVNRQISSRWSSPEYKRLLSRERKPNGSVRADPPQRYQLTPSRSLRIAINAQLSATGAAGGVEQAVAGLVYGLGRLSDGNEEYIVVCTPEMKEWLAGFCGPNTHLIERPESHVDRAARNAASVRVVKPILPIARFAWRNVVLRRRNWETGRQREQHQNGNEIGPTTGIFENAGADVAHFPYQTMEQVGVPSIFTPWDFQHEYHPEFFTSEELSRRRSYYPAACQAASAIVAGTTSVRQDICRYTGVDNEKVYLTPWGNPLQLVTSPPDDAALSAAVTRFGLPSEFAFYPAQTFPHKNHLRLLQALALLRDSRGIVVHLVCTGGTNPHFPEVQHEVLRLSLEDQVRFIGFVEPSYIRAIYQLAKFVVFPSLFEGWGFPPVEALNEGAALACSRIQPLTEHVRDAALLFDPTSVESIAVAVGRLASEPDLRATLGRRGIEYGRRHSWDLCARNHRALYRLLGGVQLTDEDRQMLAAAQPVDVPIGHPSFPGGCSISLSERH